MEQDVKGLGWVGGISSRPGATDGPGQRRWVRLIRDPGQPQHIGSIRQHVATSIGKLARPKRIVWTDELPKTRSGKIMRRLRDIAEGREFGDVTTLRDPDVMKRLHAKVAERQSEGDA